MKEIELSKTDEKLVQPEYIAEVPGIEVQGDYYQIIGPKPDAGTHNKITFVTQRMAEASKNAGRNLEANTQFKARGVNIRDVTDQLLTSVVTMTSLMEECILSSKSRSLLRKHQTTHRHWSVGVTATILTMRMTTPHQQDEDTV